MLILCSDENVPQIALLRHSQMQWLLMWPKSSPGFHPALSQATILHPTTDSGAQQQSPGKGNVPEVGSCGTSKIGDWLWESKVVVAEKHPNILGENL